MSQLAQELVDLVVAQVDDRDLLSNTALISRSWRLSSQAKQFRSFRISHPSCLPRLAGILTSPRICALVKELHVGRWSQSSPHQLITGLQDLTRETRLTRMVNVVQVTLAGLTLDTAHESFFVTHFVAPFPLLSSLCIHHCIVSATFLPRILNSRPSLHTVSLGDCRDEHPTSEDVDALPHLCRLKTLDCDDMAPNAASALARCTPAFTALTALHMSLRLSERPAVCITAAILEAAKNSIEEFHLLAGSVPPNDVAENLPTCPLLTVLCLPLAACEPYLSRLVPQATTHTLLTLIIDVPTSIYLELDDWVKDYGNDIACLGHMVVMKAVKRLVLRVPFITGLPEYSKEDFEEVSKQNLGLNGLQCAVEFQWHDM